MCELVIWRVSIKRSDLDLGSGSTLDVCDCGKSDGVSALDDLDSNSALGVLAIYRRQKLL